MRTLRRRLADAACAFQTGHSVRDFDRTSRKRIVLLAERAATRFEKQAENSECAYVSSSRSARAMRFRKAIERYLDGFDRDAETVVLRLLELSRCEQARWRWEEAARAHCVQFLEDGQPTHVDGFRMPLRKFAAKLHEGLFEDAGFYLGLHEQRIGSWNWSRFFGACRHAFVLWLRGGPVHSIDPRETLEAYQKHIEAQPVRSFCHRLAQSCGPP